MPPPADPPLRTVLAERLQGLRAELREAERASGRSANSVDLLAVTKGHPGEAAAAAVACGLRELGENYLQECQQKSDAMAGLGAPPVSWHMLGHLQRNKVRGAARLFAVIETVDSLGLAQALSRERLGGSPLPCLCEVDFTGLAGRRGFAEQELRERFRTLADLPGLRLCGLMTVAAPEEPRRSFAACRALRDRLERDFGVSLPVLSMGMSGDFREAVAEGSTQIRVGTLLFGPRA